MKATSPKSLFLTLLIVVLLSAIRTNAQNLVFNGNFNATSTGWLTSCTTVEAYAFETTYGGTDPTNHVAEIDDEACMHQDVCVLPGASYIYSMDASCRTAGGPNPCTSHINITGLDASGTVVATYVDMDYTRTNTVFALTPVAGIPVINVASGSGVVRLRITLTDNTPGYATLGMIVDNLSLVFSTPPAVISGSAGVTCQNVPMSFSVTGVGTTGIIYNWSFGPGSTPSASTSATPSASWSTSGSKTATVALGNGVCFVDTVAYAVVVNPSVTVALFDTICAGSSFSFHGSTYTTAGIYRDTVVTSGGCDSITSLHLQVNPKPTAPVITSPTYCELDVSAPLTATGMGLTWYGPGLTPAYAAAPTPSTAAAVIDTYYVTQTILGCASDSARAIVTINPKPAPPAARDTTYCQNAISGPLAASGTNLQWYTVPSGGTPSATAPVPQTDIPGTTTWYITQVVGGCESSRTPIAVNILVAPVFNIGYAHLNVCQDDTVSLYYTGDGNASVYKWILPAGDSVAAGAVWDPQLVLKPEGQGYRKVYLQVTDNAGLCNATDTLALNVIPQPTAVPYTPAYACLGDTVTLSMYSHSSNADTFYWYVDNTPLTETQELDIVSKNNNTGGPYDITWRSTGLYIIELYAMSKEGCTSLKTFDTVQVKTPPDASFSIVSAKASICLEDSVEFKAAETGYNYYYLWSPAEFFTNLNQPFTWGKIDLTATTVTLKITNEFGCSATHSMEIDPSQCCTIKFPTAFTPNGDGRNDFFRPISTGYHKFHEFKVVNRWGQVVFETNSSQMQWDGNYNGVPQDMGVYYYYLNYDCGGNTLEQKGDVTLIR